MRLHKPFTSIDEQITLLNERGLTTDSHTASILRREGYYQIINGYKGPFLDKTATRETQDDRFHTGTQFSHIHELFLFDRRMRNTLFTATTQVEALIKTTCAYEFTQLHPDEKNPYLNRTNYADSPRVGNPERVIKELKRILEHHENGTAKGQEKPYITHCIREHGGEVPLWVLTNTMTFGQVNWFYRTGAAKFRGAVRTSLEQNYAANGHKTECTLDTDNLDARLGRIKDFRNICAHDERLYCARPRGRANNTLFQCIQDLHWMMDKPSHLELLQKIESLITHLSKVLPRHMDGILAGIGVPSMAGYLDYMDKVRKS